MFAGDSLSILVSCQMPPSLWTLQILQRLPIGSSFPCVAAAGISIHIINSALAGAISAMIESLGDYYAAARISGAPVPPPDVLARGVTWQGISCVLTGCWGTGNGTTAYNVRRLPCSGT